ncbi:hypothetical protein [Companilactobacillus sp. FL22-1]|uniref:hypothetical protein n=1 Tax=Companilactobacillus sp. FL22-1 TaxID=3373892 RepID=UPI003754E4C8
MSECHCKCKQKERKYIDYSDEELKLKLTVSPISSYYFSLATLGLALVLGIIGFLNYIPSKPTAYKIIKYQKYSTIKPIDVSKSSDVISNVLLLFVIFAVGLLLLVGISVYVEMKKRSDIFYEIHQREQDKKDKCCK